MSPLRTTRGLIFASVTWLVLAVGGGVWLMAYEFTPGERSAHRPTSRNELPFALENHRPTLIVVLHPQCPCSQATVSVLAELVEHCGQRLAVIVMLNRPKNADARWTENPLVDRLKQLEAVRLIPDDGGRVSQALGATTSGHAVLFATDGAVMFAGGLTPGRGAVGETSGQRAILGVVKGTAITPSESPTFGCPLCGCESP
jgi:hypothetical protein